MKYLLGLFIALTLVGCEVGCQLRIEQSTEAPVEHVYGVSVAVGSGGLIYRSLVDLGEAAVMANPNLPASRTLQGNYVFGGNVQVLGSFQQGQTSKNVNVSAAAGAIGSITNPYFGDEYVRGTLYQNLGQQWSGLIANPFGANAITSVAYGNGVFVAVAQSGEIGVSTDSGATWALKVNHFGGAELIRSVAYGSGVFVAVSDLGNVSWSSNNGTTWSALISPVAGAAIYAVAFGSGVFVANCATHFIYSLDLGQTWTLVASPFGAVSQGLAFGNNVFVASCTGLPGKIAYSLDLGKTWSVTTHPLTSGVNSVAFGNGVFIAVDSNGGIARSVNNGISWGSLITNPFGANSIFGLSYNFGIFQAGTSVGTIARSYDSGQTWGSLIQSPFAGGAILAIASSTVNMVAVGAAGSIATAGWNAAYSLVQPVPGETSLGTRKRHFTQIVVGAAFAAGDNDVDLGATPLIPIGTKAVHVFGYFNAAGATVNTYMYLRNTNFEVAGYGFSANAAQGENIQGDIYLTTDRIVRFTVPPIGTGVAGVNIWMDYYWI